MSRRAPLGAGEVDDREQPAPHGDTRHDRGSDGCAIVIHVAVLLRGRRPLLDADQQYGVRARGRAVHACAARRTVRRRFVHEGQHTIGARYFMLSERLGVDTTLRVLSHRERA